MALGFIRNDNMAAISFCGVMIHLPKWLFRITLQFDVDQ
jgi:hypothetical protein